MGKRIVKRGSIVLVRYPFSDLSTTKVRPAVILTPDDLLSQVDDALCLFVSSVIPTDLLPTDLIVEESHPAFNKAGLRYSSVFRAHKLALLHKSLILRVGRGIIIYRKKIYGTEIIRKKIFP